MLRKLIINQINQSYIQGFIIHLKVLGYTSLPRMSASVKELFYRVEQQGKTLGQITSNDIKLHYEYLLNRPNYRTGGALSLHTIRSQIYALKLFFAYCEKMELLEQNPMSTLNFSIQMEGQREILSRSEIKLLYNSCKTDQERAIMGLFYGCGLRKTEAEKLNARDVNFKARYLYVRSGKGRKRRAIPMIESVVNDFKSYTYHQKPSQVSGQTKGNDKKAFMLNAAGTRMRGQSHWFYFKRILKRSRITKKVSLHHLRHSIATHLLGEGMSIEQVRDFLGHQFLESTQIYTRVYQNQL